MSDGLNRRSFIKLAATAGAAAAIPGCQPAARKLIPYVVPDENVIPGVASYYATTCAECGAGCGVVAKVREGRAIKLEGNPKDPISQGALCARGQAALQGLYNPDRLAAPLHRASTGNLERIGWDRALAMLNDRLKAAAAAGKNRVAFVGGPMGPTLSRIASEWLSVYNSDQLITYQALDNEPARAAAKNCFGRDDLPAYRIDQAEVLISFGADFLETHGSPVEQARQYAKFRSPEKRDDQLSIGRAIYVGPRLSMTAAKCDEWLAVTPAAVGMVALGVLHVVVSQGWVAGDAGVDLEALKNFVAAYDPATVSAGTGVSVSALTRMAEWFGQAQGALALCGADDEAAHTATLILNAVTGNVGKTLVFFDDAPAEPTSSRAEVAALIQAMAEGKVDVLVVAEANPAFTMPARSGFLTAARRVPLVVWCGGVPDETAEAARLLVPIHHPLETWRTSQPRAGLFGLAQPVMQPVFDSRPLGELLLESAHLGGAAAKKLPYQTMAAAVRATWDELHAHSGEKTSADDFWYRSLRDGGYFKEPETAEVKLDPAVLKSPLAAAPDADPMVLYAYAHPFLYDGRGASKPWLQEIPEPVSQVVWDAWAEVHPETARKIGIAYRPFKALDEHAQDVIELRTDDGTIELAAYVSERVRPGVIAVPLGQGHSAYGRYARDRGANPFAVLAAGMLSARVTARPAGRTHRLVSPLATGDMMGRAIVESISLEELAAGVMPPPEMPTPPEPYEQYPPFNYPNHKWGMTIDLNACTGCSACVAACYAENNLAVVGRDEVERGRIMSWIRIERYFPPADQAGAAPLLYIMPMLCQQCEHAPCEPVCPVFASYHTDEGLNAQIYNRCVGTRYCENNCPYKVRRFNWLAAEWPEPLNLQLNPDVTVRGAGVMEKCTFCYQRIRAAEIDALVESRKVRDGEIVPACAQACPSRAITFGDSKEAGSAMMRRRAEHKLRAYDALPDLNTLPAIAYLRDIYQGKGKA